MLVDPDLKARCRQVRHQPGHIQGIVAAVADGTRYEIIDGRLCVTRPPDEHHQRLDGGLFTLLDAATPAGWRVLWGIGLEFAVGDCAVPDLTVLGPDVPRASSDYNDVTVVRPALVVEIASRSTRKTDRGSKLVAYAEAGIPAYWRVARDGTVHIHALAAPGVYTLVVSVTPGQTRAATWPFPVTIGADGPAVPGGRRVGAPAQEQGNAARIGGGDPVAGGQGGRLLAVQLGRALSDEVSCRVEHEPNHGAGKRPVDPGYQGWRNRPASR